MSAVKRVSASDYRKAVSIFKKFVKIDVPVKVRRRKISSDLDGCCSREDNHFLIQINKDLPYWFAIEVAAHEFSHVLSWGKESDDHGLKWGQAYSKIYRIWLKEYFKD